MIQTNEMSQSLLADLVPGSEKFEHVGRTVREPCRNEAESDRHSCTASIWIEITSRMHRSLQQGEPHLGNPYLDSRQSSLAVVDEL